MELYTSGEIEDNRHLRQAGDIHVAPLTNSGSVKSLKYKKAPS
jgi:hypothetical protein